MKKPLLLISSLLLVVALQAQVLFSDDFESYTVGGGVVAQSSDWSNWEDGTDTDGMVDDAFASNGTKSCKIDGTGTDLVLPIGPYNGNGKYDVKFMMMIEEGSGGYFNLLHQWTATSATYEWAVDVYFSGTGEVTWTSEGAAGGAEQVTPGTWFMVQVTADLDMDLGHLYIDGVEATQWQWSLNNANGNAGQNQIAAVDFYGTNDTTSGNGVFWIDDVQVINSTGVGLGEALVSSTPDFFPNPANESIVFSNINSWLDGTLSVMDLTGKIVFTTFIDESLQTKGMQTAQLEQGIYLVKFVSDTNEFTRKLIVRH